MRTIKPYTKKGRPFIMRDMDEIQQSRSFGEGQACEITIRQPLVVFVRIAKCT
jgi:hypothetical protein